jgi:hypothetical protein
MKIRKIGKFYLDKDQVYLPSFHEFLATMRFVPLRVQFLEESNRFEYIGLSNAFNKVAEGSYIPTYAIKVTRDKQQKISVEATLLTSNEQTENKTNAV